MSAAQKYGKPLPGELLNQETLRQVLANGRALVAHGVVHQESLGNGAPVQTPAMKYGSGNIEWLQRKLPPRSRAR